MKTKMFLTTVAVAILSTSAGYAQRVEVALTDGHPVINCEGMPASAYTTTPKGNTEALLKTKEANAKVYKRFAVYKSINGLSINWVNALTLCNAIPGWRLPTQRELMLMWVLNNELAKTIGFSPFLDGSYWGTTENNPNEGWVVGFTTGTTTAVDKTTLRGARCVREL